MRRLDSLVSECENPFSHQLRSESLPTRPATGISPQHARITSHSPAPNRDRDGLSRYAGPTLWDAPSACAGQRGEHSESIRAGHAAVNASNSLPTGGFTQQLTAARLGRWSVLWETACRVVDPPVAGRRPLHLYDRARFCDNPPSRDRQGADRLAITAPFRSEPPRPEASRPLNSHEDQSLAPRAGE